eukprot:1143905-Pelagomonas_calceolata.AAC.1
MEDKLTGTPARVKEQWWSAGWAPSPAMPKNFKDLSEEAHSKAALKLDVLKQLHLPCAQPS